MKTIFKLLSISLLAYPFTSLGKEVAKDQSFLVKNNNAVIATISKKEITRIAFESDIIFISSIAGELEYTTKDQDLYLRPNVDKPINFFVKTADENTYKFSADLSDIPSKQIFIKNPSKQPSNNKLVLHERNTISKVLQKNILKLINVALKPQEHLGFHFMKASEYLGSKKGLTVQKVAEVSGMKLNAEIILITNESKEPIALNLTDFLEEDSIAVYANKLILNEGEKTKLIRIKG